VFIEIFRIFFAVEAEQPNRPRLRDDDGAFPIRLRPSVRRKEAATIGDDLVGYHESLLPEPISFFQNLIDLPTH
jgi:hypothetical protein